MKLKISILLFACTMIGCSDYTVNLGNGYTYVHEGGSSNTISHEHPAEGGEITSNVISYDYNKHFIIAKQKPMPFQYGYETAKEYTCRTDSIAFCYWLIVKKEQKVFGPLDYDSFQKLKKEYNVSDKLVFK